MRTPSWPFWAASLGLAGVGFWCMVAGTLALFAWVFDGMDPATQFSAKAWGVPLALGVRLPIPVVCVSAWAYTVWCIRMVGTFFAEPEPITLDRGWPS